MVEGFNSSKKSYFIWLAVFGILFVGLLILPFACGVTYDPAEDSASVIALYVLLMYCFAVFPIGFALRRRYLYWYAHVPTEDIEIWDTNIFSAVFNIVKCTFFAALDLALLAFYLLASAVIGVLFTPYFIVSGIVYMIQGRI